MKRLFAALLLSASCYIHAPIETIDLEPIAEPATQPAALLAPPIAPIAGRYFARLFAGVVYLAPCF